MRRTSNQKTAAVLELLAEAWPACFSIYEGRRKPLKIGVRDDILARVAGAIRPRELSRALSVYCASPGYLRSFKVGAERVDLDGNPTSIITVEEAAHATAKLARRRKRTAAAEQPAPPPPPPRLTLADLRTSAAVRKAQQGAGRQ